MSPAVTLTAEQRAVVDHDGPGLLFSGPSGTGKTTTLRARYLRLLDDNPASSVVVLLPTRAAAARFLESVLPVLAGGFDGLPVTTPWGLAYDVLVRRGQAVSLLSGDEQREEVARLLAADGPSRWPSSAHLLGRRAFVDEVAAAVVDLQASFLDDAEVLARADGVGERGRWAELVAFAARYRAARTAAGSFDATGLLVAAARLLAHPEDGGAEAGRVAHVLVDDAHDTPPVAVHLVGALTGRGVGATVAADSDAAPDAVAPWAGLVGAVPGHAGVSLTRAFRAAGAPSLVTCSHPAVEPEAVAGELQAAHHEGVPWSEMAVLVRGRGARRRALGRALARHGIPAAPVPESAPDEPVVRGVVDVLRWTAGDTAALDRVLATPVAGFHPTEVREIRRQAALDGIPLEAHPRLSVLADLRHHLVARAATATPAELAFDVWRLSLIGLVRDGGEAPNAAAGLRGPNAAAGLRGPNAAAGTNGVDGGGDDRSLDALVGFLDGLARRAERHPQERLADFLAHFDAGLGATGGLEPPATGADAEGVTIAPIAATVGRQWHTVVVAGCVEGDLPAIRARPRLFDRAVLAGGDPPSPAERRRRVLSDERRLFGLACSRATHRLVGTAAPAPGVMLSRFVEDWTPSGIRLPAAPGPRPVVVAPTAGVARAFPDGRLRLSASRLDTYDDCPLRYCYEYVLGARSDAGVHAALGSLVHDVLYEFCRPDDERSVPFTREGLVALAEERWRDDIARFRPQVEEARRDYFAMLAGWWDAEGGTGELAPEVLAVERRFELDVGPHLLTGFIDRIDRADDGTGIRIVDYKTGKREPNAEEVADNLQLAVYHLAASRDPDLAVLGPPTQLRLLFLRSMHAREQPVTEGQEAATEARILAAADHILAEDFEPSVDANCRLCSFQRLCPLQPEGRTVSP